MFCFVDKALPAASKSPPLSPTGTTLPAVISSAATTPMAQSENGTSDALEHPLLAKKSTSGGESDSQARQRLSVLPEENVGTSDASSPSSPARGAVHTPSDVLSPSSVTFSSTNKETAILSVEETSRGALRSDDQLNAGRADNVAAEGRERRPSRPTFATIPSGLSSLTASRRSWTRFRTN